MKPLRTILVGACAATVLASPLAASAAPSAHSPAKASRTSIRFLGFDHTRGYGGTVHVRGQVYVPSLGGALQNVHVKLYRRLNGRSHWAYIATRRTSVGAYAKFSFPTVARSNAAYRVVFRGNATYRRSHGTAGVDVFRKFSSQLENGSGRFHGKIKPHYSHHTVYLDRRRCGGCNWHRAKSGRTSGHSSFSFATTAPRHGKYYWRVSTPATTKYIRSYSSVFTTQLR
jgi:hypothetical protein